MTISDHRRLEEHARKLRAQEMSRLAALACAFVAERFARLRGAKLARMAPEATRAPEA